MTSSQRSQRTSFGGGGGRSVTPRSCTRATSSRAQLRDPGTGHVTTISRHVENARPYTEIYSQIHRKRLMKEKDIKLFKPQEFHSF